MQIAFIIYAINASNFESCEYHAKNCSPQPRYFVFIFCGVFSGASGALAFGNFGLKGAHLSSDMIFPSFHTFSSPRSCYCLATMDATSPGGGFKVHMPMNKPAEMGAFL